MIKDIKNNLLILLGLSLSLLFIADQNTPITKIDKKTESLYKEYVSYIPKSCKKKILRHNKVVIKFGSLESNFIGFCNRVFRERVIVLDANFWYWLPKEDKKQLLFHELSHCLLNKDHVSDMNHYMYPTQYSLSESVFLDQVKADIETYCSGG